VSAALDPLALLAGLQLEDGRAWGDAAADFQHEDAAAVLLGTAPGDRRLHWIGRPRGGSKTTDAGGFALVALLTQAPPRSTSHAFARDREQAGLLLDALRGLAERSGLAALLDFGAWSVTVKSSGARLLIESADAASALGARPYLVIVDELAAWPQTREARSLWQSIVSGLPKRRDSRLLVITTAGEPGSMAAGILAGARESARWRVSDFVGALPWADADDLAEQRRMLPESVYLRLHENRWTAAEDRLVTPADLAACVTLDGPLDYDPRHRYICGLDLGLKDDRTVLTVAHAEPRDSGGPRVVLDRLAVLQGSRANPVQLSDVEALAEQTSRAYGHARIRLDPWQAIGLAQRLRDRGVSVEEWAFSAQSVGRLGQSLHLLLRDHRLALPDDRELLDELQTVRLRESSPGVYRLDHDAGHHDDRAVALGLAALALTERTGSDSGGVSSAVGLSIRDLQARARTNAPGSGVSLGAAYRLSASRGMLASIRSAQRGQTEAQRRAGLGLVVEGTANDPSRVTRG
jgi:hypothetical protein